MSNNVSVFSVITSVLISVKTFSIMFFEMQKVYDTCYSNNIQVAANKLKEL